MKNSNYSREVNLLTNANEPKFFKTKDIQRIMGVGQAKAYSIMNCDGFPSFRLGNTLCVENAAFQQWFAKLPGREVVL